MADSIQRSRERAMEGPKGLEVRVYIIDLGKNDVAEIVTLEN